MLTPNLKEWNELPEFVREKYIARVLLNEYDYTPSLHYLEGCLSAFAYERIGVYDPTFNEFDYIDTDSLPQWDDEELADVHGTSLSLNKPVTRQFLFRTTPQGHDYWFHHRRWKNYFQLDLVDRWFLYRLYKQRGLF